MNKEVMAQKASEVEVIVNSVKAAQSFSVVEYRGLTVTQLESLRKSLREENAEMKVLKNTLVAKASDSLGYGELDSVLTGPNAFVFSNKDAVSAPKILAKFAKTNDKLVIKGGVVEGKVVDAKELKVIATLPNKEGLLSMLLSCLTSPVRSFACVVKAVADKEQ